MAKHTVFTTEKRLEFLKCLALAYSPTRAANAAGVSRKIVFEQRDRDEAFARSWDDALEQAGDYLEDIAIARAETKSDTMLIVMLKAMPPKRFIERQAIE